VAFKANARSFFFKKEMNAGSAKKCRRAFASVEIQTLSDIDYIEDWEKYGLK